MQNNLNTLNTNNIDAILQNLSDSALPPEMQATVAAAIEELEMAVAGDHILPKATKKFVSDLKTYDKYFP